MDQTESKQCFHLVRCAVTAEERAQAHRAVANARTTGDSQGMLLALATLSGPCCGIQSCLTRAIAMLPTDPAI